MIIVIYFCHLLRCSLDRVYFKGEQVALSTDKCLSSKLLPLLLAFSDYQFDKSITDAFTSFPALNCRNGKTEARVKSMKKLLHT